MSNRSQSKNSNPENDPNDAPEMKDPVQAGSSDLDERMSTPLSSHHSAHIPIFCVYLFQTC